MKKKLKTIVYKCHWCGEREVVAAGEQTRRSWECLHGWPWCGCSAGKKWIRKLAGYEKSMVKNKPEDDYDWEMANIANYHDNNN